MLTVLSLVAELGGTFAAAYRSKEWNNQDSIRVSVGAKELVWCQRVSQPIPGQLRLTEVLILCGCSEPANDGRLEEACTQSVPAG